MAVFSYPRAPEGVTENTPDNLGRALRQIGGIVNLILRGKQNNVLEVTLTANAASTTVNDPRLTRNSLVLFDPTTANAATELYGATMYVLDDGTNRKNGTFVITHANNANADRTFKVLIVG